MGGIDRTDGDEGARGSETETRGQPVVTTIEGSADRTVFTETGNTDAWIATDCVSDVPR